MSLRWTRSRPSSGDIRLNILVAQQQMRQLHRQFVGCWLKLETSPMERGRSAAPVKFHNSVR
jgi:hypothetical protein